MYIPPSEATSSRVLRPGVAAEPEASAILVGQQDRLECL